MSIVRKGETLHEGQGNAERTVLILIEHVVIYSSDCSASGER